MTQNATPTTTRRRGAAAAILCLVLAACSSQPPAPAWQLEAHGASQRALEAYLSGQDRIAALEWQHARQAIARTGQPALMARLELLHCAAQTASAMPWACPRFDALRADAADRLAVGDLEGVVEAEPAELGGLVHAEEAERAHLAEQLVRGKDPGLLPLGDVGVDLGRDELAHAVLQRAVLGGETHAVS